MKKNDLKQQHKEMTVDALQEEQLALLKEQMSFRVQRATGQLKKNHRVKEVRRSIARIKTLLTEKQAKESGEK
jgi:large subunit ribosomal protein L29